MRRIVVALALLAAVPAMAAEVAGVTMPDSVSVAGRTLRLTGMGVRTKFFMKVYVAGLYLERPTKDAAAAISGEQGKRVNLRMVRGLDRAKITEAISDGFQKNSRAQLPALKARLDRLNGMIPDLESGDQILLTYLPGKGTAVAVRGSEKGIIEGKDFADALFAVWLGREPVDSGLKAALLRG